MSKTRLSPVEKIGYGLGDFASNVVFQTLIILLPAFYTDVFGLAPAAMGTMFLVVRLMDTVTDPLMGTIADHTNTRWGKFRPYLLWFALPIAVVFVLTYVTPDFSESGKLIYAYITYAGLMLLFTIINIPYCALGGVITADSQERVSANSYRFFLATSAGVMITYFGPDLIQSLGGGDERKGYPLAMAVFAVLAVIAFIASFALTKERVVQAAPGKGTFASDLKTLKKNDQWMLVSGVLFLVLIPVVVRGGSALYYIKWFAARPDLIAAFLTAGTVAQMLGATCAAPLTKLMEKARAYQLLHVLIVVASVAMYFVSSGQLALIFGLYIVINFFMQMSSPIMFAMLADTVEYGELKTGRRVTGLTFSGAFFCLKLGVAAGGWLIGLVLAVYGYDGKAEAQNPDAIKGIVLCMTLLPAIGHFLLLPLLSPYKLTHKRCAAIREELDNSAA